MSILFILIRLRSVYSLMFCVQSVLPIAYSILGVNVECLRLNSVTFAHIRDPYCDWLHCQVGVNGGVEKGVALHN